MIVFPPLYKSTSRRRRLGVFRPAAAGGGGSLSGGGGVPQVFGAEARPEPSRGHPRDVRRWERAGRTQRGEQVVLDVVTQA